MERLNPPDTSCFPVDPQLATATVREVLTDPDTILSQERWIMHRQNPILVRTLNAKGVAAQAVGVEDDDLVVFQLEC